MWFTTTIFVIASTPLHTNTLSQCRLQTLWKVLWCSSANEAYYCTCIVCLPFDILYMSVYVCVRMCAPTHVICTKFAQ